jgi:hypothetical protein
MYFFYGDQWFLLQGEYFNKNKIKMILIVIIISSNPTYLFIIIILLFDRLLHNINGFWWKASHTRKKPRVASTSDYVLVLFRHMFNWIGLAPAFATDQSPAGNKTFLRILFVLISVARYDLKNVVLNTFYLTTLSLTFFLWYLRSICFYHILTQ